MLPDKHLDKILARHHDLESQLQHAVGRDAAVLSREFGELQESVSLIRRYRILQEEIQAIESLQNDPELRMLAEEELSNLRESLRVVTNNLQAALIPKNRDGSRSTVVEIRAGTGGEEAALFASDLCRLYERYAQEKGWEFELLTSNQTPLGGFREVSVQLRGKDVFARMQFESGVHRVQRVPETEGSGRIHTSAATVAVLPEPSEVEINISPSDLRIDTMRASGAGGQHVNKTDSAVRITHLPTEISVVSSEKSQHRNREIAIRVLRARLFEIERHKADSQRAADRRQQVGSGDRSERIRTYNFPQGRVTDHRINLTLYKLDRFMQGDIDEMIDALISAQHAQRLAEIGK